MNRSAMIGAVVLMAACGGTVSLGPGEGSGAGVGGNSPGGAAGKGGQPSMGGSATMGGQAGFIGLGGQANQGGGPGWDGGPGFGGGTGVGGAPGPTTCAGNVCGAGQVCCHLKAQCMDAAEAKDACPVAPPIDDGNPSPVCGSDATCASGEFCELDLACTGPGHCHSKSQCGWHSVPSCGCDGKQYDYTAACNAGIAAIQHAPCGSTSDMGGTNLIVCGNSSAWCKGGDVCCPITGYCYDPAKPLLCVVPPAGTYFPCIQDTDCPRHSDYCVGPTCGAPGGCVSPAKKEDCTGQWAPVCGCDGKTYVNAICASVERVAVDYTGQCK
jgi:hypothetical protein